MYPGRWFSKGVLRKAFICKKKSSPADYVEQHAHAQTCLPNHVAGFKSHAPHASAMNIKKLVHISAMTALIYINIGQGPCMGAKIIMRSVH